MIYGCNASRYNPETLRGTLVGVGRTAILQRLCHGGRIYAYDRATFGSRVRKSILGGRYGL